MPKIKNDEIDTAEQAYHAYGSVTDWKNYQGLPMPKFPDLPEKIQLAWCKACEKVRELVKK